MHLSSKRRRRATKKRLGRKRTMAEAALRKLAGHVVEVRHLGKHLHFCTIDEGSGAAAVQVCFELAAFDDIHPSAADTERTPFPDTKSQLKPQDRVVVACRAERE